MHGYGSAFKERPLAFMASELTAYCDDSGQPGTSLVIAGYWAPAMEWLKLEAAWQAALDESQLAGFPKLSELKMHDLEQGEGEFEGRPDRPELVAKFWSLIDSVEVQGYAVRADIPGLNSVRAQLGSVVTDKYNEPYLHVFSALVQMMATDASSLPEDERIAFVFDEQDEFRFRALQAFGVLKETPDRLPYRDRLAGIRFDNSKRILPLQAADALAYRTHRDLRNGLPTHSTQGSPAVGMRRVKVGIIDVDAIRKRL